jgi:hypothetical protein
LQKRSSKEPQVQQTQSHAQIQQSQSQQTPPSTSTSSKTTTKPTNVSTNSSDSNSPSQSSAPIRSSIQGSSTRTENTSNERYSNVDYGSSNKTDTDHSIRPVEDIPLPIDSVSKSNETTYYRPNMQSMDDSAVTSRESTEKVVIESYDSPPPWNGYQERNQRSPSLSLPSLFNDIGIVDGKYTLPHSLLGKDKEECIQKLLEHIYKLQGAVTSLNQVMGSLKAELKQNEDQYELWRERQKLDQEAKMLAEQQVEQYRVELKKKEEENAAKDKHIRQLTKKLKQARKESKDNTSVQSVGRNFICTPIVGIHT